MPSLQKTSLVVRFIALLLFALALTQHPAADAADTAGRADSPVQEGVSPGPRGLASGLTPLAGEEGHYDFMGRTVDIPPRNRDQIRALTLGATVYSPRVASSDALPIPALYWRSYRPGFRTRAVVSIFVNELDAALNVPQWANWELLAHAENNTNPFPQSEVVMGREDKGTSIVWGNAATWLGLGYRIPVAPFQVDNDLRLQMYYNGGYLYSNTTGDSRPGTRLPPSTYQHGFRFRARYDGLSRNIMELPHLGYAAGADLEWTRRDRWSDANYGGDTFDGDKTRDYFKVSAYLMAALPVPGTSEKNRLIASIYGGAAPDHNLDRFSAFRLGGGPFPNESDDLWRHPYPGATFDQFPVSDYIIGTLEFRRELLFFLYLHLRGTFFWGKRDILTVSRNIFREQERGQAISFGLTSGFFWDSSLYLEYSHDSGLLRDGMPGESFLVMWSKNF